MSEADGNGALPELPEGWEWSTVAEVTVECRRGRAPAYENGSTIVVNQKCVRGGTVVDLQYAKLTNEDTKPLPGWALVKQGDILINSTGTGTLGRVGWLRDEPGRATLDTHVTLVRPDPQKVLPAFLGWVLHSAEARLVAAATGSTSQKELSRTRIEELRLALPPLHVQTEVVRRIEAITSVWHDGVNAVEGAEVAAQQFLTASMRDLLDSPDQRVPLGEIAEIRSGLAKGRKTRGPTQPRNYLRAGNLGNGELLLDEIKTIEATDAEADRFRLVEGDVLLVEGSGSPRRLGQGWVWDGQVPDCLHQNHVFAVRPDTERIRPLYLAWALQAPVARTQFLAMAKTTSGLSTLNKSQAASVDVRLPSLNEQDQLIAELQRRESAVTELSQQTQQARREAARLFQSFLHSCLTGRGEHRRETREEMDAAA